MHQKKLIRELTDTGIVDAIGDPISIQGTDFKVLYQNQRLKEIVGDQVGKYCYKAYQGNNRVCKGCHLAMTFKDGATRTVERSRTTDNGIIYSENTASILRDPGGEIIAGIEVVRDITKRKLLEERLSHSLNDWRDTFDNITDMITIHDKDFNIILANRAARERLGLPPLEEGVTAHKCFLYYHGTKCPPAYCSSSGCLKSGKPDNLEIFEPHLNMFIEIRSMPRLDGKNNLVGMIHIARDITMRKQMEETINQYNDKLERLVEERTAKLVESNRALLAEVKERRKIEKNLRLTEKELVMRLNELKESNIALKVLLKHREEDRGEVENNILSNIKHLISPNMEKLRKNINDPEDIELFNILESNLYEIISPFSCKLSSNYLGLSQKEIQIADLIKQGKQDKEIMEIQKISLETVKTHRKNIRKKLGIYGNRINLRMHLMSKIE